MRLTNTTTNAKYTIADSISKERKIIEKSLDQEIFSFLCWWFHYFTRTFCHFFFNFSFYFLLCGSSMSISYWLIARLTFRIFILNLTPIIIHKSDKKIVIYCLVMGLSFRLLICCQKRYFATHIQLFKDSGVSDTYLHMDRLCQSRECICTYILLIQFSSLSRN